MSPFVRIAIAGALIAYHAMGLSVASPIAGMDSRDAPTAPHPKAIAAASLEAAPVHQIPPLTYPSVWEGLQRSDKTPLGRKYVSFGREPSRFGIDGRVSVPPGSTAVRVEAGSRGALQMRTAWRFDDDADYEVWIVSADERSVTLANRSGQGLGTDRRLVWSAVTDGDSQRVFIRRLGADGRGWTATLERIAHFDTVVETTKGAPLAKALGDSAFCQRDIACIFGIVGPAFDNAALIASRSVAFMLMTDAAGASSTCTGTLLNSANYPAPLFLTANHCVDDAVTLDTFWFFSRTNCGFGTVSPAIQVTGGAMRLWSSAALDSALLLLAEAPPPPASYSGWNPNPITATAPMLAIHHPRGDVKKASLGFVVEVNSAPVLISGLGTFPAGTFYLVDWEVGIVEPGSSGSSFFTERSSPYALQMRGTLTGGNTTCSGIASRTYYSRFDNIYPHIEGPLTVPVAPSNPTVVEYFHSTFGHYFMTSLADEINKLDSGAFVGWARTGQTFSVYPLGTANTASVCRFFTVAFAPKSSHFYTPSASECAIVKNNPNWMYEALVFAFAPPSSSGTCPSGTIALYRLYNNGKSGAPNHRYTTNLSTRNAMISQGWTPEGNGALGVIGCVPA